MKPETLVMAMMCMSYCRCSACLEDLSTVMSRMRSENLTEGGIHLCRMKDLMTSMRLIRNRLIEVELGAYVCRKVENR